MTKLGPLERFLGKLETEGQLELRVEVARTTMHHHKGDVFRAEGMLRVPGGLLRAEERNSDVRTAIDAVRTKLKMEIEKHKAKGSQRSARKNSKSQSPNFR